MLEQMRQNSRSFIIWLLFGIIIAVFIISFGPQAGQTGCSTGGGSTKLVVDDVEVDESSWRYGMNALSGANRGPAVFDYLVQREILAQAAEEAGFRVTTEMVNDALKRGDFWILGEKQPGKRVYFEEGQFFNFDLLESFVSRLGLSSMGQFIDEQRREILADSMRQLIRSAVQVSREEAQASFLFANDTATLDVVPFRPSEYRAAMTVTAADVERYLAAHDAEVRAKYDAEAASYKDVKPQVRLRQIFLAKTPAATPEPAEPAEEAAGDEAAADEAAADEAAADEATDGEPADAEPAAGEAAAEDEALARLQAARARIVGGAEFATVATELEQGKGGLLGWRTRATPALGATELTEALKAMKAGDVSEVISTPRGHYLLKVEAEREGDLSYEEVKGELAEELAAKHYAELAARRAAEAALAEAQASGKALDELYERRTAPPQNPFTGPDGRPISQEEIEEMIRRMQQQQGGGAGAIYYEGTNQLAQSGEAEEPAAPAAAPAATEAPAKPAKPKAPATTPDPKPAVEVRSTGSAPATGTGRPSVTATPGEEPAEAASGAGATAAGDTLAVPELNDPPTPQVRDVGPFPRDPDIAGLGKSQELMKAAFAGEAGKLLPQVFEVSGDYYIAQVVDRTEPNLEEFERDADSYISGYREQRAEEAVADWLLSRCEKLAEARKIEWDASAISRTDPKTGEEVPVQYQPCFTLQRMF